MPLSIFGDSLGIIEYLVILIFAVAVSIGGWMSFEWFRVTRMFKGRIYWIMYTLAAIFMVCSAVPCIIGWLTGNYSLFYLFAIFALLAGILCTVSNVFYYRKLREKIPGRFSSLQFILYASPFIIFFPIIIAVVLLYPPKGIVELFLLTAPPVLMLLNSWIISLNYGIQRHKFWKFRAIDSLFGGFYFFTGGLFFLLGFPGFLLPAPILFGLLGGIGQTITNRKLLEMAHSPPPAAEVVIGNYLTALGEFSDFTNRLLVGITPEAGRGTTEQILAKHFEAGAILKGCEFKEGKMNMRAAVKNIQRIPRKERTQQVFGSFHCLHSDLVEAHAAATSRERGREVFNESFASSATKYGESVYRYGLPMLLSWRVLEPAVEKCRKSTLQSLRSKLEELKREDPLLAGLELDGNRLNLKEFYSEISKPPIDEIIPRTVSSFSRLTNAWYPLIRKDLGKQADGLLSSAFSSLIERYPLAAKLGVLEVLPEGVELPGISRVEPGRSYLIEEPKSKRAFEIFEQSIRFSLPTLCVSTVYPEGLEKRYKLDDARVIWLSKQEVKNAISPEDLDILRDTITEFTEEQRGGVILLDGFEHLTTMNGFDQALRFLHDLVEKVAINRATLLVSVNPEAFDKRQLAMLQRNMEVIKEG